jgi:hypothetical protein
LAGLIQQRQELTWINRRAPRTHSLRETIREEVDRLPKVHERYLRNAKVDRRYRLTSTLPTNDMSIQVKAAVHLRS